MDKYEFSIKAEQIKKLSSQGDYKTAMQIADTIETFFLLLRIFMSTTESTKRLRIFC